MARNSIKNPIYKGNFSFMTLTTQSLVTTNEIIAHRVLNAAIERGVTEFCVCAGSRNSPFVIALAREPNIKKYYWFEERSAAFFAIGRAKSTGYPVAVITTSGTAAAELLPATMEAHYTGTPILLLTADRPRRFRGSGAPQSAEQEGLFGVYVNTEWDIANEEPCTLTNWTLRGPAHLNVCFEEPDRFVNKSWRFEKSEKPFVPFCVQQGTATETHLNQFLKEVSRPLVIVSSISHEAKEDICHFLLALNAPVVLEGVSKLREDTRLQHLRVSRTENLWKNSEQTGYKIDGILRIGGVPTIRLWRDLEDQLYTIPVFSINDVPFSGLSRSNILSVSLEKFFKKYKPAKCFDSNASNTWIKAERDYERMLLKLIYDEPRAEPSLFYQLSRFIPEGSLIYLGNSLPLREWDQAATFEDRRFDTHARRGVNGIDGQISTFLGLCSSQKNNWALIGDLTAMYDMVGPWIIPQLISLNINIVVINNSGGRIFKRMYDDPEFLNIHERHFGPLAEMWGLFYEKWTEVPKVDIQAKHRLIEIVPDNNATERFLGKISQI
jgi:2-succinyl-5-enolpyruvyl-6-hydroxy-3-cyclohexene-1-carboxylate synthase